MRAAALTLAALGASASTCGCGPATCRVDEGVVHGDPGPAPIAGLPLRAMTLNLLHGFNDETNDRTLEQRLAVVIDEVSARLPDVLLVQEASVTAPDAHCNVVDMLRSTLSERTGVSWQSVQAARNGADVVGFFEGPALLSWHPLLDARVVEYAAQAPFEHRAFVRATTSIEAVPGAGGAEVTWFSTHLTDSEADVDGALARLQQARALAAAAASTAPSLVGGDLNALPGSSPLRALEDAGGVDLWPAVNVSDGATSLDGAVDDDSAELTERIDYLIGFSSTDVPLAPLRCDRVLAAPVDGLWASDHAGVACEVALGHED